MIEHSTQRSESCGITCIKYQALTCAVLQNLFFGFAGLVAASAAWSIFGSDIFPQEADPTGGEYKDTPRPLNNISTNHKQNPKTGLKKI